jgi:hypothetical protein
MILRCVHRRTTIPAERERRDVAEHASAFDQPVGVDPPDLGILGRREALGLERQIRHVGELVPLALANGRLLGGTLRALCGIVDCLLRPRALALERRARFLDVEAVVDRWLDVRALADAHDLVALRDDPFSLLSIREPREPLLALHALLGPHRGEALDRHVAQRAQLPAALLDVRLGLRGRGELLRRRRTGLAGRHARAVDLDLDHRDGQGTEPFEAHALP